MDLISSCYWIFVIMLLYLSLLIIACLVRAIKGPSIADRVVAVNMMGTIVIVVIGILSLIMREGYLTDICLIYAMISFLAVVVLTKVYTGVYLEKRDHGQKLMAMENADKEKEEA